MGRFRGFTLYTGMINAPLVIPEVIQGISLLLLFVEMAKVARLAGRARHVHDLGRARDAVHFLRGDHRRVACEVN